MKTYTGDRTIDGIQVLVDGSRLATRAELKLYAEMGFEWGYEGPEPRQLAFALLVDHLGDARSAERLTDPFMTTVVANLDNVWSLSSADIDGALRALGWTAAARAV